MSLVGPEPVQSLESWVTELSGPSSAGGGMELSEAGLDLLAAGYGTNRLTNGSFEKFTAGASGPPDDWTLTGAGGAAAQDTDANDVQEGTRSVRLSAALNTATDIEQHFDVSTGENTRFRGRRMTFSCLVKASTASRVFLNINDGTNSADSPYHPGDGEWHLLYCSITVATDAVRVEGSCGISSGAAIAANFDCAKLEEGDAPTAFSSAAGEVPSGSVILGDLADLATQRVIGRNTAGTGTPEAVTAAQLLDWLSSTQGVILYRSGSAWVALAVGTKGKALTTGGASANPSWEGMTTQGDIEYHDGTSRARLAAGTSGYFLKTQGAGANPVWAALAPASDAVTRSAGDVTTTLTTFQDITSLSITITTGANRVLLGFTGSVANDTINSYVRLTVSVDATDQGGANFGLTAPRQHVAAIDNEGSFTFLTAALSAASHTFKARFSANANTATVRASDPMAHFFAVEVA